jgi:hypothetical protein
MSSPITTFSPTRLVRMSTSSRLLTQQRLAHRQRVVVEDHLHGAARRTGDRDRGAQVRGGVLQPLADGQDDEQLDLFGSQRLGERAGQRWQIVGKEGRRRGEDEPSIAASV